MRMAGRKCTSCSRLHRLFSKSCGKNWPAPAVVLTYKTVENMIAWLSFIPALYLGALLMVSAAILSIVALLIFRRFVSASLLKTHNDSAGVIFQIIGTLYTVLLAFVVITVWGSLQTAEQNATDEAGTVGDMIRDVGFFPEPIRSDAHKRLREYVNAVVENEWPAMAVGKSSPRVWNALSEVFKSVSQIQPMTARQINVHSELLKRVNDLSMQRRHRLLISRQEIPTILWYTLLFGAAMMVFLCFMLGVESAVVHATLTGSLVMMMVMALFLIHEIDHPFRGEIHVDPSAMQLILKQFDNMAQDYSLKAALQK